MQIKFTQSNFKGLKWFYNRNRFYKISVIGIANVYNPKQMFEIISNNILAHINVISIRRKSYFIETDISRY